MELLAVDAFRIKNQELGKINLCLEVADTEVLKKTLARFRGIERVLKVNG